MTLCSLRIRFSIRREQRKPVSSLHCICLLLPVYRTCRIDHSVSLAMWIDFHADHLANTHTRSHVCICLCEYECDHKTTTGSFVVFTPVGNVLIVFFSRITFFCNRNAEKDQSPWAFFRCIQHCMHASERAQANERTHSQCDLFDRNRLFSFEELAWQIWLHKCSTLMVMWARQQALPLPLRMQKRGQSEHWLHTIYCIHKSIIYNV